MPTFWKYCVALGRPCTISDIYLALECAEDREFHWRVSGLRGFAVMQADGMDEVYHADVGSAVRYLAAAGGGLTLWRKDDDVFMTVNPHQRSIDVGVLYDLRSRRDENVSNLLGSLFKLLCAKLEPTFGFASQDEIFEHIFPDIQFEAARQRVFDEAERRQPPSVLFWLNYLSREYFEAIGPKAFQHVIASPPEPFHSGVLIYLADAPWNARLATRQPDGRYSPV